MPGKVCQTNNKTKSGYKVTTLTAWSFWISIFLPFVPAQVVAKIEAQVTYADLVPIFSQYCVLCHSGDAAPVGLRLDNYDSILQGSKIGPVVKAGDPSKSELIRRIKGTSQPQMPMTGPPFLSDKQTNMFESWVTSGTPEGNSIQPKMAQESTVTQPDSGEAVTYMQVAPIFARRCVKCHIDGGLMGSAPEGYLLTSYETTLSVSDRVRVVPGNPGASELVRRIRGFAHPKMPYDGPPYLKTTEIRLIEDWVIFGAKDTEGHLANLPVGAKVRLHGTLTSRWQLDGLELIVTSRTRIDKSPSIGDYVEVRGRLNNKGKVVAERIRRR